MKFCVSLIHLGRYKIDLLDDNDQIIVGHDGGSALVMLMLTEWLFRPEHNQYQRDQKANSDQLGEEVIAQLKRQAAQKQIGKSK